MERKLHRFFRRALTSALGFVAFSAAHAESGDTIFAETFPDSAAFAKWTIIDNNGGRTWEYFRNEDAAYMLDYQTGLPGDDYLVSPGFKLEAGKVYDLYFDLMMSNNINKESCRVLLGSAPTIAGLTDTLGEWKDVTNGENGRKRLAIVPKTSGTYYVAFYSFSLAEQNRFEVDNVDVVERGKATVPAEVGNITVTPAAKGELRATVAFTLPVRNAGGDTLSSTENLAASVYRDDSNTAISALSGHPGDPLSTTDSGMKDGFHTYKVVVSSAEGSSLETKQTAFVGKDAPKAPTDLTVKLNKNFSTTLLWTAPKESLNGGYVDFSALKYNVFRDDSIIATVAGTSYADKVPVNRGQKKVTYRVTANYGSNASDASNEAGCVAGEPLKMPYKESAAGGMMAYPWYQDVTMRDFDWSATGDFANWGGDSLKSADKDGGFLVASISDGGGSGEQSRFVSPMLDLSTLTNPEMSFYFYYNRSTWYDEEMEGEINDRLKVQVSFDGGEWQDVDGAVYYENQKSSGWEKVSFLLPRQNASFAQVALVAISENDGGSVGTDFHDMYVDDISIDESMYQHDMALTDLSVDKKRVNVGDTQTFTATVMNRGAGSENNYKVVFYRDGKSVAEVAGAPVQPASSTTVSYKTTATISDCHADGFVWKAEIVDESDQLASNNTSSEVNTSVRKPEVPAVDGLTGVPSDNSVSLTWNPAKSVEPKIVEKRDTVTDDFESYKPFAIDSIGQWTVYDGDKSTTLVSPRIPVLYEHEGEPMAFQVFNTVKTNVWNDSIEDMALMPHSGSQYMICPAADWPNENDDWLITPRLDGRKQTVSFWAKAASYESEWINVYYSTTDTHHDSFVKINDGKQIYVNDGWTKFNFEVPDSARYFAVRCVRRTVLLLIDDFTYSPWNGSVDGCTLTGYNVYRDGKLIAHSDKASYTDTDVVKGEDHTYNVTAVYKEGESDYSNDFTTTVSGVGTIKAVGTGNEIYNLSGMRVNRMQPGQVYILKKDGKTVKVLK